ncbi:exodeoxyribonuclease III [Porticoccus sp.]
MKIVSFNVNGLRARMHQLAAVIEQHTPDIIGLQETKVSDELFPLGDIEKLGYGALFHGQKGHYGVALLYRLPLQEGRRGFPQDDDDSQKRLVYGRFEYHQQPLHIYNGYFPQGESRDHPTKFPAKRQFYTDLYNHIAGTHHPDELVVVMGDMNVAPLDSDIGIGEDNRKRWLRTGKCCFLPEEREWLERIENWGLVDSFDHFHPGNPTPCYSWFDYRSRGFEQPVKRGLRIDLLLASKPFMALTRDAGIDYQIRAMAKPSDHCPVWLSAAS